MLYFRPRHKALNVPPGPLPPPLTAVAPICSRRRPSPLLGQVRGGSRDALRMCESARAAAGGAMQTSSRADAPLKGSRPGQRWACARASRSAAIGSPLRFGGRKRKCLCVRSFPVSGRAGWFVLPGWLGRRRSSEMAGESLGLVCPAPPARAPRADRARPATLTAEEAAVAWPLGGTGLGAAGVSPWGGVRPWGRPALFLLCWAGAGAGSAPVPPTRGSAVAWTWGKEAERELGAAVAGLVGGGAGEGWPRWARATGESGVCVESAANFPPLRCYGRAAAGQAGSLGLAVPTLSSGEAGWPCVFTSGGGIKAPNLFLL